MNLLHGRPTTASRHCGVRHWAAGLSVVAVLLTAVACGSSDDSPGSASDAEPAATSGAAEAADEVDDAGDVGAGTLTINTDTGESWTLEQYKCLYQPDNEGTFVELWGAGAEVPTGGEFIVIASTPADPSSGDEITVDGTLIDDANDILYVVIEGEAESDGSTMTMTLGMHSSALRVVGDPIDLTATVTCEL